MLIDLDIKEFTWLRKFPHTILWIWDTLRKHSRAMLEEMKIVQETWNNYSDHNSKVTLPNDNIQLMLLCYSHE